MTTDDGTALPAGLQRQHAFWRRENHDRAVVGFTGSYFAVDTAQILGQVQRRIGLDDIDVGRVVEQAEHQYEAWQGCTGDLSWSASTLYQFRWLAAAWGAPVFASGESVWAAACLDSDGLEVGSLSDDNCWLQKLWQATDALVRQAAGRYPVAANEFLSPLSTLVELRGNTEFAFDLYDRREEVKRDLAVAVQAWVTLVERQVARLPGWHGGYTSAQRFLWAPGPVVEFSEDPAFMLSPQLHGEIVLPAHRQLLDSCRSSGIAYPYIHLHSTQLHTLDALLAIDDLPAIELTPDYGASIPELLPVMAKIQASKPLIVHAFFTADEMRLILDQIPPEGLCLIGRAHSPDGARRLQDEVCRW
jgi:hypothetical protein